jgi:hypothetical protein
MYVCNKKKYLILFLGDLSSLPSIGPVFLAQVGYPGEPLRHADATQLCAESHPIRAYEAATHHLSHHSALLQRGEWKFKTKCDVKLQTF